MEITQQQASDALEDIKKADSEIRGELKYRSAGDIMILWGIIWLACFCISHFAQQFAGWSWAIGDGIGIAATALIAWRAARHSPVKSQSARRAGWRVGLFWFALFIFADVWLAVLWPWRGVQLSVFVVTLVMFAYVTMGLWLEMWFMVWLGLIVTALAAGAYFLWLEMPIGLNLWLGILTGGALLISGVYLRRKWG